MEPTEIQEFTNQLKEGGEESLTSISLAISILAVLVAMVTVLGHRTHTEAVLAQSRATDQWNEYQAKKIRSDNLSVVIDALTLGTNAQSPAVIRKISEYQAHMAKWKDDLAESQTKARELEAEVTLAERRASHYDLGEALLQIAVVACSITLFTRKKSFFLAGVGCGILGALIGASALLLR